MAWGICRTNFESVLSFDIQKDCQPMDSNLNGTITYSKKTKELSIMYVGGGTVRANAVPVFTFPKEILKFITISDGTIIATGIGTNSSVILAVMLFYRAGGLVYRCYDQNIPGNLDSAVGKTTF